MAKKKKIQQVEEQVEEQQMPPVEDPQPEQPETDQEQSDTVTSGESETVTNEPEVSGEKTPFVRALAPRTKKKGTPMAKVNNSNKVLVLNKGQRAFNGKFDKVTRKMAQVKPGENLVDKEWAEKLAKAYPKEIRIIGKAE